MWDGRKGAFCRQVAAEWGAFLSLHTQSEERSCICAAAGRRREERAAHRMHGRRGSRVQRGRHVHTVPCDVLHFGRYLITPIFKAWAVRIALHTVHLGTYSPADSSTCRDLSWSSYSKQQLWGTEYLVVLAKYTVSYHEVRCLRALVNLWHSFSPGW